MNIVLECEVTLSKKLEAICEQGEPLSVLISSIAGNKGRATMRVVCKDGTKDSDIAKIGETSIQFKVVAVSEDVKTLTDASRFSNIVSSGAGLVQAGAAVARTDPDRPTLSNRDAGVNNSGDPYVAPAPAAPANPLEALSGNPDAVKALMAMLAAAGVTVPGNAQPSPSQPQRTAPQAQPRPPQVRDNSITSYDELMAEITAIPGIDQEIRMPTDRKLTRGEADQILSRMPKLRRKAFIRNTMQAQLLVGDLYTSLDGSGPCLAMLPGQAFDLTRLPAKNILSSNDFRWCVETQKIAFVNAAEYAASFKRVNDEAARWSNSELPVYGGESARTSPTEPSGGVAESLASGAAMMDDGSEVRIGSNGPDPISLNVESSGQQNDAPPSVPYEESPEMQSLISQMPSARQAPQQSGTRRMR